MNFSLILLVLLVLLLVVFLFVPSKKLPAVVKVAVDWFRNLLTQWWAT